MAQAVFILLSIYLISKAWNNFMKVRRNILLGKDERIDGDTDLRWKNVLLVALGQRKMFKNWIPAVLHLVIYASFVITQIELIEIVIDGSLGTHRFFAPLGGFYTFVISFIEILSLLTFFATLAFLARRYFLKVERFQKPELEGFPRIDAALILIFEIMLIIGIFSMNCADIVLQTKYPEVYPHTGHFAVSGWLGNALLGNWDGHLLAGLARLGWWLHYLMVLVFLNYLPFSKHLHILFAFPNTYYARLTPHGQMENMPAITHEVRSMMGLEVENVPPTAESAIFGAKDVTSLSWKNLLDAYTCTECGRCTAACPANLTGKLLSPRKVMMDVRDRMEEVGKKLDSKDKKWINTEVYSDGMELTKDNFEDGKTLFDYISPEELHACTTCNACVEACPVLINPLDIILQMRRYEILMLSAGPSDWLPMFTSLENSGAVWQMSEDRDKWVADAL